MLGRLSAGRGWEVDGERLYDEWDRRNKASQRDEPEWIPFAEHCRRALHGAYGELGLPVDADEDIVILLRSVGDWPLWPDVADGLLLCSIHHHRAHARTWTTSRMPNGDLRYRRRT